MAVKYSSRGTAWSGCRSVASREAAARISRFRRPTSACEYFAAITSPCSVMRICLCTAPEGCARMAPTEVRRKSAIDREMEVANLLAERDRLWLTPEETAANEEALRSAMLTSLERETAASRARV